ncbi:MAG: MAPEG family protein [Kofleriaceae bacterium]
MSPDVRLLVYAAILTWVMIMVATFVRSGGDLLYGFGNREAPPPASALAGRADRAAKNMLENMILFTAVVMAAQAAGHHGDSRVVLGARLFFWARLAYWPTYLAGVRYLRTGLWAVSVAGLALIVSALL